MDASQVPLITILWVIWGVYWLVAARGVKATQRLESATSRAAHIVPLMIAGWLLAARTLPGGLLSGNILPPGRAVYVAGAFIVAVGLAFAIWARRTLGRNWSGVVTVKQDHELVREGPYRLVRHPIYTGLFVMYLATAILLGRLGGLLLGTPLVFASFWIKLRDEEAVMLTHFPGQYSAYQQRTKRIIPFVL